MINCLGVCSKFRKVSQKETLWKNKSIEIEGMFKRDTKITYCRHVLTYLRNTLFSFKKFDVNNFGNETICGDFQQIEKVLKTVNQKNEIPKELGVLLISFDFNSVVKQKKIQKKKNKLKYFFFNISKKVFCKTYI